MIRIIFPLAVCLGLNPQATAYLQTVVICKKASTNREKKNDKSTKSVRFVKYKKKGKKMIALDGNEVKLKQ